MQSITIDKKHYMKIYGSLEDDFLQFFEDKCMLTGSSLWCRVSTDIDYVCRYSVMQKFLNEIGFSGLIVSDYKGIQKPDPKLAESEADYGFTCFRLYFETTKERIDVIVVDDDEFRAWRYATRCVSSILDYDRNIIANKQYRVTIFEALKASYREFHKSKKKGK